MSYWKIPINELRTLLSQKESLGGNVKISLIQKCLYLHSFRPGERANTLRNVALLKWVINTLLETQAMSAFEINKELDASEFFNSKLTS